MLKPAFALLFSILVFCCACHRTGLKKYYTRISSEELASYDSIKELGRSGGGIVYNAVKEVPGKFSISFNDTIIVLQRLEDGRKAGLYKVNGAALANDSTFILYDSPLMVEGTNSNFKKGLWFYTTRIGSTTNFKVDTLPTNLPPNIYESLGMGIYVYKGNKLLKVSSQQTEEAFSALRINGFVYLPNPGRFYRYAKFTDIN